MPIDPSDAAFAKKMRMRDLARRDPLMARKIQQSQIPNLQQQALSRVRQQARDAGNVGNMSDALLRAVAAGNRVGTTSLNQDLAGHMVTQGRGFWDAVERADATLPFGGQLGIGPGPNETAQSAMQNRIARRRNMRERLAAKREARMGGPIQKREAAKGMARRLRMEGNSMREALDRQFRDDLMAGGDENMRNLLMGGPNFAGSMAHANVRQNELDFAQSDFARALAMAQATGDPTVLQDFMSQGPAGFQPTKPPIPDWAMDLIDQPDALIEHGRLMGLDDAQIEEILKRANPQATLDNPDAGSMWDWATTMRPRQSQGRTPASQRPSLPNPRSRPPANQPFQDRRFKWAL